MMNIRKPINSNTDSDESVFKMMKINDTVTVTVDRPLGSYHPEYKDLYYPLNYGYVEGIMADDGEYQDAYILGVNEPIKSFTGKIIAFAHRKDDVEDKLIVASEGMSFSPEEIYELISFQEKYFDTQIIMNDYFCVHNKVYNVIRLLGHGKGGYSYLCENDDTYYIVKQIHHEEVSYYQFGNKIEAEAHDYERLLKTKIRIPEMIDIDKGKEIIVKEYIEGKTIMEMIDEDEDVSGYIEQVKEMERKVREYGLNIDYYPTNFVVNNYLLYYIDYECNEYDPKWNLENWGLKYWQEKDVSGNEPDDIL